MFTLALGTSSTGFEGQFRFLADVQGLSTSAGRHPRAEVLPVFNSAYRQLRELVTAYGYTQFVTRGATTALPTTPVETGEGYATIAVPQAATQIKMIDVKVGGQDFIQLPECTLLQLRDHARSSPDYRGPHVWCWIDSGSVSGSTFTAGKIALAPTPRAGSYALWTATEFTDLSADTDVYLYHAESWRQWHLYRAMADICGARDKDTAKKLDLILYQLNPENPGTPAALIRDLAPTAAGPKTWTRSSSYRGSGPRR